MPSSGVSMKWDFREAALPPGVEVVNGEAEFMLQSDGSSALFLPPMAYLKISFGAGQEPNHTTGLGGQLINDYTLSMDIFLESLPSESMSLFQCAGAWHSLNMFSAPPTPARAMTCVCIHTCGCMMTSQEMTRHARRAKLSSTRQEEWAFLER